MEREDWGLVFREFGRTFNKIAGLLGHEYGPPGEPPRDRRPDDNGRHVGVDCPKCGKPMVKRYRKSDQGPFYGCSSFPECNNVMPAEGEGEPDGDCPF